jgi:hypothetical protein
LDLKKEKIIEYATKKFKKIQNSAKIGHQKKKGLDKR